jgi:hypothetical protein
MIRKTGKGKKEKGGTRGWEGGMWVGVTNGAGGGAVARSGYESYCQTAQEMIRLELCN